MNEPLMKKAYLVMIASRKKFETEELRKAIQSYGEKQIEYIEIVQADD